MSRRLRTAAAFLALFAAVPLAGACADEDGDGATTDEEIQDGRDKAGKAGDEIQQEIDGQNKGSNENGG